MKKFVLMLLVLSFTVTALAGCVKDDLPPKGNVSNDAGSTTAATDGEPKTPKIAELSLDDYNIYTESKGAFVGTFPTPTILLAKEGDSCYLTFTYRDEISWESHGKFELTEEKLTLKLEGEHIFVFDVDSEREDFVFDADTSVSSLIEKSDFPMRDGLRLSDIYNNFSRTTLTVCSGEKETDIKAIKGMVYSMTYTEKNGWISGDANGVDDIEENLCKNKDVFMVHVIPEVRVDGDISFKISNEGTLSEGVMIMPLDATGENRKFTYKAVDDLSELSNGEYYVTFSITYTGDTIGDKTESSCYEVIFKLVIEK